MITSLTDIEKGYVIMAAATMQAAELCGVDVVTDGMTKFGDKIGIDTDKMSKAIIATVAASAGAPYEHGDLIPAVTQAFRTTSAQIYTDIKANKTKVCAQWVGTLREWGTVK